VVLGGVVGPLGAVWYGLLYSGVWVPSEGLSRGERRSAGPFHQRHSHTNAPHQHQRTPRVVSLKEARPRDLPFEMKIKASLRSSSPRPPPSRAPNIHDAPHSCLLAREAASGGVG